MHKALFSNILVFSCILAQQQSSFVLSEYRAGKLGGFKSAEGIVQMY